MRYLNGSADYDTCLHDYDLGRTTLNTRAAIVRMVEGFPGFVVFAALEREVEGMGQFPILYLPKVFLY